MASGTDKVEYKERIHGITKRMTVTKEGKELEVHSTMLGYPIRFELNDDLRNFLRNL